LVPRNDEWDFLLYQPPPFVGRERVYYVDDREIGYGGDASQLNAQVSPI
jgi:hypothetical protein